MSSDILKLERFGVAFGRRVVLASIDLRIASRGVTTLMGPVGVGKSTLLRTLAGRNDGEPSLRTWGRATYRDVAWRAVAPPVLVGQGGRVLFGTALECIVGGLRERANLQRSEQRARVVELLESLGMADCVDCLDEPALELSKVDLRCVSLATAIAADPALLLVDEPTVGLRDHDRERVIEIIRDRARDHAVLVVTHSQVDALTLSGSTALLAGGAIIEHCETSAFFSSPRTPIAQVFVESGSCSVASPPTLDQLVADGLVSEAHLQSADEPARRQSSTWEAFPDPELTMRWIEEGKLVGIPRPGLLGSLDRDVQALAAAGIRLLICLEESQVLSRDLLERYGIESHALPIVDMDVPSLGDTETLCEFVDESINGGRPVAVHCRAGLGRTGAVLTAYLIWKGLDRDRALTRARTVEPRFVQSERQLEFLSQFEVYTRAQARRQPTLRGPPFV